MKVYSFPFPKEKSLDQQHMHIDLDRIIAIGPVSLIHSDMNETNDTGAWFKIHVDGSEPIDIIYHSGNFKELPPQIIMDIIRQRDLLVEAWIKNGEKS